MNYQINVTYSSEHNSFIATSPEIPDLTGFGDTEDGALEDFAAALVDSRRLRVLEEAIRSLTDDVRSRSDDDSE